MQDPNMMYPEHYGNHPSGVECIEITKHLDYCTGSTIKHLWRHSQEPAPIEELRKALQYIQVRIEMYERGQVNSPLPPDPPMP